MKRLLLALTAMPAVAYLPATAAASPQFCDALGRCVSATCVALNLAGCFGGWITYVGGLLLT